MTEENTTENTETEAPAEGEYTPKLQDAEYKDDTAVSEKLYGDEYNMSLFKELMKARNESERDDKTGDGKVVEMGKEDTATPVPNKK